MPKIEERKRGGGLFIRANFPWIKHPPVVTFQVSGALESELRKRKRIPGKATYGELKNWHIDGGAYFLGKRMGKERHPDFPEIFSGTDLECSEPCCHKFGDSICVIDKVQAKLERFCRECARKITYRNIIYISELQYRDLKRWASLFQISQNDELYIAMEKQLESKISRWFPNDSLNYSDEDLSKTETGDFSQSDFGFPCLSQPS